MRRTNVVGLTAGATSRSWLLGVTAAALCCLSAWTPVVAWTTISSTTSLFRRSSSNTASASENVAADNQGNGARSSTSCSRDGRSACCHHPHILCMSAAAAAPSSPDEDAASPNGDATPESAKEGEEEATADESNNGDESEVTEITATDEGSEDTEAALAQAEAEAAAAAQAEAVAELKKEIADWEGQVKMMRRRAADTADTADEYTKAGYARKVAEMENMRRARSMLQSSNKYSAVSNVLQEFVPVMDTLYDLRMKYGDDEFGKQYNALPGAIKTGFSNLGCTDVDSAIAVGQVVNTSRMTVVATEYSAEIEKDCVIGLVAPGMELQGNTIRLAQVVASLGKASSETSDESGAVETATAEPEEEVNE